MIDDEDRGATTATKDRRTRRPRALRWLTGEFRRFPATMGLCSAWLIVFALLVAASLEQGTGPVWSRLLPGAAVGHRFGDLTVKDLERGEVWRTLTATFIHYGILHIGLNLLGMYQLGTQVESWYGSSRFLGLYVVIGGGGNALSGWIRDRLGSDPRIHSAGGSTVLLGLVALCAVVGWRGRTRTGDFLFREMMAVLVVTALLGLALPMYIDNWGHLGGALVGGALGFADPVLARGAHRRALAGRLTGVCAGLLLIASVAAQARADHAEAPIRARDRLVTLAFVAEALPRVGANYRLATSPWRSEGGLYFPMDARLALPSARKHLEAARGLFRSRSTRADFDRLAELIAQARTTEPDPASRREFEVRLRRLMLQALKERDSAFRAFLATQPLSKPAARRAPRGA